MFPFMMFIFLCFLGVLATLYHILRTQEKNFHQLEEEHAQLRVLLRAMESRLDELEINVSAQDTACATAEGNDNANRGAVRLAPRRAQRPSDDDLLHLDFDSPVPQENAVDPALDLHFDPGENTPQQTGTR